MRSFDMERTKQVTLPCGCRQWQGPMAGGAFFLDYGSDMCAQHMAEARAAHREETEWRATQARNRAEIGAERFDAGTDAATELWRRRGPTTPLTH
jgi:hypothetical protein